MLKAPFKPKRCPWCNSNLVAQIIHEIKSLTPVGRKALDDGKAVLGVRMEEGANPKWQCMDCGAQIYGQDARSHANIDSESFGVVSASKASRGTKPGKKEH